MKILLTGGGSGGHFYPIIAIVQAIREIQKEQRLIKPKIYYVAPEPFNKGLLFDNEIIFKKIPAGKLRRYFSVFNFFDIFKTFWGLVKSIWTIFYIYPDVIFSKGGYGSFPSVVAAKIFRIPLVIHESDIVPGKTNKWASKFARRIAVSWAQTAESFPKEKVAYTGNPIREEILEPIKDGAKEFLSLEENIPVILVLGGSLGAQKINDLIMNALPKLVEKYQIIHQVGEKNFEEIKQLVEVVLQNNQNKNRYKPFDFLNNLALQMSAGTAELVISRAGSTIFEIASWGKPSIIIPITDSNGDHQRKNAYAYGRSGACIVIEESNLSGNILNSEINRLFENPNALEKMSENAKNFAKKDAAKIIARELLNIALEHQK